MELSKLLFCLLVTKWGGLGRDNGDERNAERRLDFIIRACYNYIC